MPDYRTPALNFPAAKRQEEQPVGSSVIQYLRMKEICGVWILMVTLENNGR